MMLLKMALLIVLDSSVFMSLGVLLGHLLW